jgi:hypothetical protein
VNPKSGGKSLFSIKGTFLNQMICLKAEVKPAIVTPKIISEPERIDNVRRRMAIEK